MALRDAGKASVAYVYLDFRDVDKQTLSSILPSLLIQLSTQSDPCCDILYTTVEYGSSVIAPW